MGPDDTVLDAGRALLGERIRKAKKEIAAAKKGDPDGVHDLRVAIRKVRSVLPILTSTVLDERVLAKDEKQLKRLFSALGDARDDDVLLARVEALAKKRRLRDKAIDRLKKRIARDRSRAKKRLASEIARVSPKRVLDAIERTANDAKSLRAAPDDPNVVVPSLVRDVAGSVLVARFEQVLAYDLAMPARLPVLHRLRVAVKKLRYAIDFFADALPLEGRRVEAVLHRAQDQLGELHDHQVATEIVARFEAKEGTSRALRSLRDAEDDDAKRLLAAFEGTWEEITSETFRRQLFATAMLAPSPKKARVATLALRRAQRAA